MAMTRGSFPALHSKDFSKVFASRLGGKRQFHQELFIVENMDTKLTKESSVTGFGLIPEGSEGGNYDSDTMYQGFDKTYQPLIYKVSVRITHENMEDEIPGVFRQIPAALGDSAYATTQARALDIFNNADTDTGPDGVSFLSTAHPQHPGTSSTWSNRPASHVDLSLSALEDAYTALAGMKNERDIPAMMIPDKLLIPVQSHVAASKLLETERVTGTNNNDINFVNTLGWNLIPCPFLGDGDAWFVGAPVGDCQLKFKWREQFRDTLYTDDANDDAVYKIYGRFIASYTSARGWYGSTGA